jgi:hypothetical protein
MNRFSLRFTLYFIYLIFIASCSKNESTDSEFLPAPPSNLDGSAISLNQIKLSWTDNSTNESGFKIERKEESANYQQVASVAKDINSFIDETIKQNVTYTYRIYSYNSTGNSTTYSNEVTVYSFGLPKVVTDTPTVAGILASCSGNIISEGTGGVTEKGFVWSTQQNPTITLPTKSNAGAGLGKFVSNIIDLAPNTTYFIRSFAKNLAGVSYGNQVSFTTGNFNFYHLSSQGVFRNDKFLRAGFGSDLVIRSGTSYIAGTERVTTSIIGTPPYTSRAFFSVNGSVSYLTNKEDGAARKIVLNNSDVYVAGEIDDRWVNQIPFGIIYTPKPAIWKNGTPSILGNIAGSVYSLDVSGNDIYSCGTLNGKPVIWKNGTITQLSNSDGRALDIKISGNDIYVVGWITSNGQTNPTIWKNGVQSIINNSSYGIAAFIEFIGSDLYISGGLFDGQKFRHVIWKNGTESFAVNAEQQSVPSSMLVHEGNIYLLSRNVLYKNGKLLFLLSGEPSALVID